MTTPTSLPANLFSLHPRSRHASEDASDGTVVVVIPKFTNRFIVRWFVPLLARPDFRLRLDRVGSFVWKRCDGSTTVLQIAEEAHREFGDTPESMQQRVAQFIHTLVRQQLLTLHSSEGD